MADMRVLVLTEYSTVSTALGSAVASSDPRRAAPYLVSSGGVTEGAGSLSRSPALITTSFSGTR